MRRPQQLSIFKCCKTCGAEKLRDEFPSSRSMWERVGASCQSCETERVRAWKAANPERTKQTWVDWRTRNGSVRKKNRIQYRAGKRQSVPRWFGELDALVAAEAMDLRLLREKATGQKWHVDHQIPLKGETVCGLHVWNNLAVIPAILNLRKGNKYQLGPHD